MHLIPLPSHLSFLFNILLATILKLTIDYIVVYHHFPAPFIFHRKAPPSAISPSFRYTSVPTISNPIYSHNIYLTLSQINQTALSATKTSHNFQVSVMLPPPCRKNLKSSKIIIRLFLRRSAVTPDAVTVYAPSDIKTDSS